MIAATSTTTHTTIATKRMSTDPGREDGGEAQAQTARIVVWSSGKFFSHFLSCFSLFN
jgi:hypothetical protein